MHIPLVFRAWPTGAAPAKRSIGQLTEMAWP